MEQITAYNILPQQKTGFSLAKLIIYLLLSLGILISAYLLYRYWLLASGQAVNTDVCSAVFGKGCDSALKNDVSNQLGLPLAAWGLLYYASLLALLVAGRIWRSFQSASPVLLLLLSFLGCLASITLLIMMIIDPQLFCPFCVALHVLNLLLFMSLVKFVNNTQDEFFNQLKQEGKLVFTKRGKEANYKRLALGSVLLLAAMLYSGLYLFSQNAINTSREFDAQKFLAGYNNTSVQEISVGDDDPVLGERNSAVEIIVFSDFQCSGCNYFSAVVREIHKRYPGKVHTVYKYFPLNIACNNTIETDMHPRGCEVAWAAEAARQQGKFWEFHDSAFRYNLDKGLVTVCSIADSLKLNHNQFEIYRTSEAARNKIARTVAQAKQLGILETPSVFINGKLLGDFKFKPVETVVRHILNMPPMIYPKED